MNGRSSGKRNDFRMLEMWILCGLLWAFLCGCTAKEGVNAEQTLFPWKSDVQASEAEEDHEHTMVTDWVGLPADCNRSGYKIVSCSQCGLVESGEMVPALEHIPVEEEICHGNCVEESIRIYHCSLCNEQLGYERHTEPGEHLWGKKETLVWDETSYEFVKIWIDCCERCNLIWQEEEWLEETMP